MIGSTERLREFERWYASKHLADRTYEDALAVFAGLWKYAVEIGADFPADWEEDVKPDIELARVLNGLPPKP
jgi:hypothetical protein